MTGKLVRQFLVWFLTTGAIVGVAVWGWNIETRFVADMVPVPAMDSIEEMRTGGKSLLAVASKSGSRVQARRLTLSGAATGEQSFVLQAEDDAYAIFPTAERIVSAHDHQIRLSPLIDHDVLERTVDLKSNVSDVAVSDNGAVLASTENSELYVLNPDTLAKVATVKLPFRGDNRLQASGSYVAVVASERTQFAVYDLREPAKPRMSEYRKAETPFDGALLSGSGRMMMPLPSSLMIAGKAVPTPGFVRGAAFLDSNHLAISGDFPGIYRLNLNGEAEKIADAPSGNNNLAIRGASIAAAGPDGLTLLNTRKATMITPTGQNILMFWGLLIAGLLILQLFRLGGTMAVRTNSHLKPLRNYQVPEELSAAFRANRCALFAGEDLAASSGLPTWNGFTRQLFDWMHDLNLIEEDRSDEIRGMFKSGRTLDAGRRVIEEMSARPALLLEYARGIYIADAKPSPLHRAVAGMPVARMLTGALDVLLERAIASLNPEILTPGERPNTDSLPLWKLRGRFDHENGVTIVPEDAARRQDAQDALKDSLRNHTVLFVATTPDELAAWLDPLPADAFSGTKVYAFAVNTPESDKKLATLTKKIDIEVVLYAESERDRLREMLQNFSRQPASTTVAAVL